MQIGSQKSKEHSEYKTLIDDNISKNDLDNIIYNAEFPLDYDAFDDENLDMIP